MTEKPSEKQGPVVVKETLPKVKPAETQQKQEQPSFRRTTFTQITNAYEFLQFWNSIHPKDINSFAHLLINVQAVDLPKFIGSKLDDAMLTTLLKAIHELITDQELCTQLTNEKKTAVDYLKSVAKSQRFNVIKLFLSQEQKKTLNDILTNLKNAQADDLAQIRKSYDL